MKIVKKSYEQLRIAHSGAGETNLDRKMIVGQFERYGLYRLRKNSAWEGLRVRARLQSCRKQLKIDDGL
jgi:hypothetical protein